MTEDIELVHIKRAKKGVVYKVQFSDVRGFSPGDTVTILENKRICTKQTVGDVEKLLACPNSSTFQCKNNTTNKKYGDVHGGVYLTENLDA